MACPLSMTLEGHSCAEEVPTPEGLSRSLLQDMINNDVIDQRLLKLGRGSSRGVVAGVITGVFEVFLKKGKKPKE